MGKKHENLNCYWKWEQRFEFDTSMFRQLVKLNKNWTLGSSDNSSKREEVGL